MTRLRYRFELCAVSRPPAIQAESPTPDVAPWPESKLPPYCRRIRAAQKVVVVSISGIQACVRATEGAIMRLCRLRSVAPATGVGKTTIPSLSHSSRVSHTITTSDPPKAD